MTSDSLKNGTLKAIFAGKSVPFTRPGTFSAIAKQEVAGQVRAESLGINGDEQGDKRVHGGLDKAVHCYPWSHYSTWRSELPEVSRLHQCGAFGENFSVEHLDETKVCIGDVWQIGSAIFEVSQSRQPCWKLNDHFGVRDMSVRVQDTLRTGWYLRVVTPGDVRAGEAIEVLRRPYPDWSIARLQAVIRDRTCDPDLLRQILQLPLPDSARNLFARRLETAIAESWQGRLEGR